MFSSVLVERNPWAMLSMNSPSGILAVKTLTFCMRSVARLRDDEVLDPGMSVDVVRHERAERDDLEAPAARVLERGRGEPAAEPSALDGLVDLGVEERDSRAVAAQPIRGLADHPVAEPQLVALPLGDVDDFELVGHQPSKPFVLCVPSQNGLLPEPPQRQRAARSPS